MCFLYGIIGAVIRKLFSSLRVLSVWMISEQLPKVINKVLGARGWFPVLCALLAYSHWQFCESQRFLFYFSGVLQYQLLLCIHFPSPNHSAVALDGATAGDRDSTGLCQGKATQ